MTPALSRLSVPNMSGIIARIAPLAPVALLGAGCDETAIGPMLGGGAASLALATLSGLLSGATSAAMGLKEADAEGKPEYSGFPSVASARIQLNGRDYTTLHKVTSWAGILGAMFGTYAAAYNDTNLAYEILGAGFLASTVAPAVGVRLVDGLRNFFGKSAA